jgi:hypothetical protein
MHFLKPSMVLLAIPVGFVSAQILIVSIDCPVRFMKIDAKKTHHRAPPIKILTVLTPLMRGRYLSKSVLLAMRGKYSISACISPLTLPLLSLFYKSLY